MIDPKIAKSEFKRIENLIYENKIKLTRLQLLSGYFSYCEKNKIAPLELNPEDSNTYKKRKIAKILVPFFTIFIFLFGILLLKFDGNWFGGGIFILSSFLSLIAYESSHNSTKYELLLKQLQHGAFDNKSEVKNSTDSLATELAQLDKLYQSGTLTEAEFSAAKSKLISK